jgi:hypothetical protein
MKNMLVDPQISEFYNLSNSKLSLERSIAWTQRLLAIPKVPNHLGPQLQSSLSNLRNKLTLIKIKLNAVKIVLFE